MEPRHDLDSLLRQAADELAAEYVRIRARSNEDPGTAGDQGEENWAELLRAWLPATYHVVTKGRILTSRGEASRQIDVLVLTPTYPVGLLRKKLYLAAGVMAAFECKTTLRISHIHKAVETAVQVNRITRADPAVQHHLLYGMLAHAYEAPAREIYPGDALSKALEKADHALVMDPRDGLDLVCVASTSTWIYAQGITGRSPSAARAPLAGDPRYMTVYFGPAHFQGMRMESDAWKNPFARFLGHLLSELGKVDPALAPIGRYFDEVGLIGVGGGMLRYWADDELPMPIRESVEQFRRETTEGQPSNSSDPSR